MVDLQKTFHESWYRVAPLRVKLRPQVKVHRQRFRGETWFVLEDPFNNQFYRLRPAAWEWVSRLNGNRSIEKIWNTCLERNPEEAPGQTEVIQLLAQLYQANLIYSDLPADVEGLFKRFRKRRQRETRAKLVSFMFARFPLLDPDRFLVWSLPVVGRLFSKFGVVLWGIMIFLGLKVVVENFPELLAQGRDVLAPGNLVYLYLGIVFLAVLHEFGHAYACRKFGGEVHTMGIMLLVFTPLPYLDASASWSFRRRWQRIMVASSGMIFELFFAAIAALIWAATGPGFVNSIAYNMMFAASVSTLLFNANPLLRFDGYYILADTLNIPNLYGRGQNHLKFLAQRFLFGMRQAQPVADNRREAFWLTTYGISSFCYRIFVFAAIVFFVGQQFLVFGLLLAFFCVVAWVFVPTGKLIHFLLTDPKLDRTRWRAISSTACLIVLPLAALNWIPFSHGFSSPGVVEAREYRLISPEVDGHLVAFLREPGTRVAEGDPLLRLENPELAMDLRRARGRLQEVSHRRQVSLLDGSIQLAAMDSLIQTVRDEISQLERRKEQLTLRAPVAGVWVAPDLEERLGQWFSRGQPVGMLLDKEAFRFSAVISQQDASRLFSGEVRGAEIRLRGQAGNTLPVDDLLMIPMDRRRVPSPALTYAAGGEIAAQPTAEHMEAEEAFFEVRGQVAAPHGTVIYHGQSGRLRMQLPPEPLLQQWILWFRQLLQTHY